LELSLLAQQFRSGSMVFRLSATLQGPIHPFFPIIVTSRTAEFSETAEVANQFFCHKQQNSFLGALSCYPFFMEEIRNSR
jgi:hypothetical protein